ncbi:MAG: DUF3552 domain-containing protein [Deltaproteobacteria bacterium]|nr:DUF3552 domain-containing protein [Deltaproteobacteria bacterium]
MLIYITVAIILTALSLSITAFFKINLLNKSVSSALEKSNEIVSASKTEANILISKAKEEAAEIILNSKKNIEVEKTSVEEELHQMELRLEKESQRLSLFENELRLSQKSIDSRYTELKKVFSSIQDLKHKRRSEIQRIPSVLEETAHVKASEVSQQLSKQMIEKSVSESQAQLRQWDEIPESEFTPMAKRILGIAIGRLGTVKTQERPSSIIALSKAHYDRILAITEKDHGTLNELFGMNLNIIENGDSLILKFDTLDAVKKEIARRVLEKLPDSVKTIQDLQGLWDKKSSEMDNELTGFGRKAFKLAGLKPKGDKEIIRLLGRLFYRTSYTQNQWLHSVEAAQLAGLMAWELHMDVETAKRATLLHDIGKALTHEIEGSHAEIGGDFGTRFGESPQVVEAISSHHGETESISLFTRLVMAADAMSGARPGARRELVESYMDRIRDLESVARTFDGVKEVFAVQAGRELRIMVDNKDVDENHTSELASGIAKKISDEVTFPGQIKVMVIRRYKVVEYAR